MSIQDRTTDSGIPVMPLYTEALAPQGLPGIFPFMRGIYPRMYRERSWTIRQYAGFSTAEESNQRFHYLLNQGVNGLSVAFDLPTQIGYDPDHPLSQGEVGKVGVSISTLEDMEALFDGIALDSVSTSMTINATAFILLAMYIAVAKKKGIRPEVLSGTIQNDILKEYTARGTYIFPPEPSIRLITDVFEFCHTHLPKWNTISISGYHIREAGSTAVEELAFTLANGKAYVLAALQRGLNINEFGSRLSFFFNAHNHLFEEVAKFRAARTMWASIMKDLGATDPKAQMLRFHSQTGGSTLTAQQPLNNISRVTIQALAAVLGGTQSLHTNSYDEALSLPSVHAAEIALRTQQILNFESGVTDCADPLGGSYYIESLTQSMMEKAGELISEIDQMGGAVKAVQQGFVQDRIARSAYEMQKKMENGEKKIVGMTIFNEPGSVQEGSFRVDDALQAAQTEKVNKFKNTRDKQAVDTALQRIRQEAQTSVNLMPATISAVESGCTLGEISQALREQWGEYR